MNFRLTAILFGTIFVLGAVLLVMSFTGGDAPPTDLLAEELAGAKPNEIDALELEREGGGKLRLVRTDKDKNRWEVAEPFIAKADPNAIGEIIAALLKAKPTTYPGLSGNPAVHGLQPVGLKVTLRKGAAASTINFGDVTLGGNKAVVFVTTSARSSRPMAVPRASVESLFRDVGGAKDGKAGDLTKWANDFRVKSVFAADTRGAGDDVTALTLSLKDKKLSLVRGGGGWVFVEPAGWAEADSAGDPGALPGTLTGVRQILGELTSLQALSGADFLDNPTPQDLEKYGVNVGNPDAIRVEILNKENEKTVAFIGKKDVPATPAPSAAGPQQPSKWWVRVEGQPGILRANAGNLGGLTTIIQNPDPLRDRNLLTLDKNRIDGVDLANGAVKLRKVGAGQMAGWKLFGSPGDPQTAVGVDPFLAALTERRIIKSFPAPNAANFGPGEVTIKVWTDGFEPSTDPKADPKAEPKQKTAPITITFGKKQGDEINVRRVSADGKTTDYFLLPEKVKPPAGGEPVDLLAAATKPRLDYMDRDLKMFSSTMAGKLTVSGGLNFDLDRDDKIADKWTFAAPADQKGRTADAATVVGLLDILATTPSATRIIDENPTPEKLAEFGLGPVVGRAPMPGDLPAPRFKVVVALRGGDPTDKDRVYEFGKDADANSVYARQAGRPAVFTLPKFVAEKFTTADLRDKVIFTFDPTQVTSMDAGGWAGTNGFRIDLKFVKKDGVWSTVAPTPAGYTLDPAKVEAFLMTLSRTRVKTFKNDKSSGDYGILDPNHSLGFKVEFANRPGIIFTLGKPTDGDASYFGWTSIIPDADAKGVITVDAFPFKIYKEKPGAFAK